MGRGRTVSLDHGEKFSKFIWRSIVCRFKILQVLVTNNGRQFNIEHRFTSLGYPQKTRQAEVTDHTILYEIKIQLDRDKGLWADELPNILQAYRTMSRMLMNKTPFNLIFRTVVVIIMEIELQPIMQNGIVSK